MANRNHNLWTEVLRVAGQAEKGFSVSDEHRDEQG